MDIQKSCPGGCGILNVLLSVLVGIALALLLFCNWIVCPVVLVWIALCLSILGLIGLVLAVSASSAQRCPPSPFVCCLCVKGPCLLLGSIGTMLSAIAALIIPLVDGFMVAAVLLGLVSFFFMLMLLSFVGLIYCTLKCLCKGHGG